MQFSAGEVISRAVGVTFKNFLTFFVIGVVVMGPLLAVNHALGLSEKPTLEVRVNDTPLSRLEEPPPVDAKKQLIGMVLNMVGQSVLAGALAFGVFQSLRGARPGVGECLARGFARLLPIIGTSIVYGLCVGLASLALLVPGIMVACAWYVCVPVTTVEGLGVGDSLSRSGALTRGYRWSIFGMFLLILLLGLVSTLVLAGVAVASGPVVGAIVLGVWAVFVGILSGTLSAVCYHDLRVVKEGASTEDLVKVFT